MCLSRFLPEATAKAPTNLTSRQGIDRPGWFYYIDRIKHLRLKDVPASVVVHEAEQPGKPKVLLIYRSANYRFVGL